MRSLLAIQQLGFDNVTRSCTMERAAVGRSCSCWCSYCSVQLRSGVVAFWWIFAAHHLTLVTCSIFAPKQIVRRFRQRPNCISQRPTSPRPDETCRPAPCHPIHSPIQPLDCSQAPEASAYDIRSLGNVQNIHERQVLFNVHSSCYLRNKQQIISTLARNYRFLAHIPINFLAK